MHPLLLKLQPSPMLVCRMLATVICATVAILRPTTKYAGPYTYLIMITKDVVFPPTINPAAQVEALVVNFTGVLIGLGWSNLGLACCTYAARRYGVDSAAARSIKACFLVLLAFVSGVVRSALPRLAFASKGACFIGIWLLSRNPITLDWNPADFTQLLFVCAISGTAGLLVALFMRMFTHPGGYAKDTIDALGLLNKLLKLSTQMFEHTPDPTPSALCITSSNAPTIKPPVAQPEQIEALQKACLNASLALHTSYGYSAFEVRIGRVPVRDIKSLLTTVNRVREELAWGQGSRRVVPPQDTPLRKRRPKEDSEVAMEGLDASCRACAHAISDGLSVLRGVIGKCYGVKVPPELVSEELESSATLVDGVNPTRQSRRGEIREPLVFREKIIAVRVELKAKFDSLVHQTNREHTLHRTFMGETVLEPQDWGHMELFQKSLKATSLLHMSSELIRALTLADGVLTTYRTSRPRLFLPRPSWFWLGMSPRALIAEEDPTIPANTPTSAPPPDADVLSITEAHAVLPDLSIHAGVPNPSIASVLPEPSTAGRKFKRSWKSWVAGWAPRVWMRTPKALRWRISISAVLWRVKHSKHVQHGIKVAFGVAMFLIPAVLPQNSPGKKYFSNMFGVWAIISFLYVLEPNTGMTLRIGIWRFFGTFVGVLYAYIALMIVGVNPYGIVIFVTAAEIMLTWLVRSSTPGVGIVASVTRLVVSVTIPPIMYIPYLGLEKTSIVVLALIRGLQIVVGIIAAIIVNHVLFPRHCRVLFLSGMAQVLEEVTGLYLHLCHRTYNDRARVKQGVAHAAKMELRIRELIARENLLLKEMEHEVSLMPKPTGLYRAGAETAQRIADLLSGLRRIRENVPHEAIEQVLEHRQHSVSCVCIVLFACEHAFRSRRALPQMLPSPRKALDALSREVMERMQDAPMADMGYAVAENEVLEEIVEALERLIEIARALFGTSSWLDEGGEISGSFGRSGAATPGG